MVKNLVYVNAQPIINHIVEYNAKHNLLQQELLDRIDISRSFVAQIRNRGVTQQKNITALGKYIGVDLEQYIDWEKTEQYNVSVIEKRKNTWLKLDKKGVIKKGQQNIQSFRKTRPICRKCTRCNVEFKTTFVEDKKLCNKCLIFYSQL